MKKMAMKKIWKDILIAAAGSLVLLGVALLVLGLVKPGLSAVPVRAREFEDSIPQERVQELISLAFPSFAKASEGRPGVAGAKVPFQVTHQSPEQVADFTFNALGSIWEAGLPKGNEVAFAVRFKSSTSSDQGGDWSEWRKLEEEDDLKEDPPPGTHYGRLVNAGDALHFQYKAVFTLRDAKEVPSVPKIKLTYIDSRGKAKTKGRSVGAVFRDAVLAVRSFFSAGSSYEISANAPSADVPVISRAGWGADESYRFDKNGNEIWSPSYTKIEKMIVHHTVFSDRDPKAAMRAVYYYHAVTLGFGDILYNFLIDRSGNIYEGRYGGDGVVSGHTRGYNWGSLGVAALGDFRYDTVTNQIKNALDRIAVWKFSKYNVDPTLDTFFVDRTLPSVFQHGYVRPTACAGTNLNAYVPALQEHARYLPQEVVVKFKDGTSEGAIVSLIGRHRLTEVSRHGFNTRRFQFGNDRQVGEVAAAVRGENIVVWADANHVRQVTLTPNDPQFSAQWNLTQIKAPEAWDISPGGDPTVTVAVLDTGVAYESYLDAYGTYAQATDFGGTTFVPGYDTINNDTHANDDHGHGTAVTSIIAATINNGVGIAGIAYAAKIMPVKVLDQYGSGTDVTVADGIYWAVDNGAKVLNLSLGSVDHSPILQEAVDYAIKVKGAVVVAAAGNQGKEGLLYPARYGNVVAVGASDMNGNRTWYSNYGEGLDLLAPGGDLKADLDGNGTADGILFETIKKIQNPKDFTNFEFRLGHGTSFATPHVAATAAIMVTRGTIWPESLERFIRAKNLDMPVAVNKTSPTLPHPNGVLLRAEGTNGVYLLEGGKLRGVPNPLIYEEQFGSWDKIRVDDPYTISTYPKEGRVGFPDGTLLKGSTATVYVLEDGKKRPISSAKIFEALGYRWNNIIKVSDEELEFYPYGSLLFTATSHPNGSLIKTAYSAAVYFIEQGTRRPIPNPAVFLSHGFEWRDIVIASTNEMVSYSQGERMNFANGSVLKGPTTTVYAISEGKKRAFASAEAYLDLGYTWDDYRTVSDSVLNLYPTGTPIY